MSPAATPEQIRSVNVRYHDAAAGHYDAKWGVGFDARTEAQVRAKLRKALGHDAGPWDRVLEIGAGTGYLAINLLRMGIVRSAVATDISPGMVAALERNAREQGVGVEAVVADAESLPFPDASFDAVVGHAVLHHVPSLERAFAEFARVLRPGGAVVFAGEPSRRGDRLAAVPKRLAWRAAPAWRRLVGARPAAWNDGEGGVPDGDEALEPYVDVHAFAPDDLARPARAAGLANVRVAGEELLANWFGWTSRTLEASADPETVPRLWIQFAYRGYLALQRVDRALLEGRLPADVFYNLSVAARRP